MSRFRSNLEGKIVSDSYRPKSRRYLDSDSVLLGKLSRWFKNCLDGQVNCLDGQSNRCRSSDDCSTQIQLLKSDFYMSGETRDINLFVSMATAASAELV